MRGTFCGTFKIEFRQASVEGPLAKVSWPVLSRFREMWLCTVMVKSPISHRILTVHSLYYTLELCRRWKAPQTVAIRPNTRSVNTNISIGSGKASSGAFAVTFSSTKLLKGLLRTAAGSNSSEWNFLNKKFAKKKLFCKRTFLKSLLENKHSLRKQTGNC